MRESYFFLGFIVICLLTVCGLFLRSRSDVSDFMSSSASLRELTSALKLTDMSFSTDARYTRHPSQADIFSAFQDYPGSIEHFPSGSVVPPPDFSGSLATISRISISRK